MILMRIRVSFRVGRWFIFVFSFRQTNLPIVGLLFSSLPKFICILFQTLFILLKFPQQVSLFNYPISTFLLSFSFRNFPFILKFLKFFHRKIIFLFSFINFFVILNFFFIVQILVFNPWKLLINFYEFFLLIVTKLIFNAIQKSFRSFC